MGNPIYNDSLQVPAGASEISAGERECYDILHHNVGTISAVNRAYEVISNLPTQPSNRHSDTDIEMHPPHIEESSAYAQLGAEGISTINVATEDVQEGVNDNEFRSPYANIFDIDPSD